MPRARASRRSGHDCIHRASSWRACRRRCCGRPRLPRHYSSRAAVRQARRPHRIRAGRQQGAAAGVPARRRRSRRRPTSSSRPAARLELLRSGRCRRRAQPGWTASCCSPVPDPAPSVEYRRWPGVAGARPVSTPSTRARSSTTRCSPHARRRCAASARRPYPVPRGGANADRRPRLPARAATSCPNSSTRRDHGADGRRGDRVRRHPGRARRGPGRASAGRGGSSARPSAGRWTSSRAGSSRSPRACAADARLTSPDRSPTSMSSTAAAPGSGMASARTGTAPRLRAARRRPAARPLYTAKAMRCSAPLGRPTGPARLLAHRRHRRRDRRAATGELSRAAR